LKIQNLHQEKFPLLITFCNLDEAGNSVVHATIKIICANGSQACGECNFRGQMVNVTVILAVNSIGNVVAQMFIFSRAYFKNERLIRDSTSSV
jgi:hypothetical protein